jgi:hypothetical protein
MYEWTGRDCGERRGCLVLYISTLLFSFLISHSNALSDGMMCGLEGFHNEFSFRIILLPIFLSWFCEVGVIHNVRRRDVADD